MGPPFGSSDALNQTDPSLKIWVGNLPQQANGDHLRAHFRRLQEPRLAEVLYPGVGCVTYDSQEAVAAAVSAFNHSDLGGNIIKVDSSASKGYGKGCGGKKGGTPAAVQAPPAPPGGPGDGMGDSGKGGQKGKFDKGSNMGWGTGPERGDMVSTPCGAIDTSGGCGKGQGGCDGGQDGRGGSGGGRERANEDCPGVFKVNVDPSSQLVAQGFPREAPGIAHDEDYDSLFTQADHLLADLVGSFQEFCNIVHDPDWEQFPDVAKAVQAGGGPQGCPAIAACPNAGKWAVGLADGSKDRETTAKLALAVSLAKDDRSVLDKLRGPYPMFYALCMTVQPGGDGQWHGTARAGQSTPSVRSLHWLALTQDSGITKAGFPPEALCIVHGGKFDGDAFVNSHNILCELMEDVGAVEYIDDPDWNVTPEVGEALKAAQCVEMPFTVAKSKRFPAWGVGVGSRWMYRETAAKLSLGLSICGSAGKLEQLSEKYPEFHALCNKAGLVEAGLVQPPSKRRKAANIVPI